MLDEFAIQQTLNRYSEGTTRGDWAQVMSTFTPDAIWEVPEQGHHSKGYASLQATMSAIAAPFQYVAQINSPAIITVVGDKATARSVIREVAKFTGRDEAVEILGIYADELVRTTDGWKFTRRTFEITGIHNFALLARAAVS